MDLRVLIFWIIGGTAFLGVIVMNLIKHHQEKKNKKGDENERNDN